VRKELNLVGDRYKRLEVLSFSHKNKYKQNVWKCLCDCGETTLVIGAELRNGRSGSCGCLQREAVSTHNLTSHPLYNIYNGIKQRCYTEECVAYSGYGGRGIIMCERWADASSGLQSFIEDMQESHIEGLEIDRIDVNGNYEPSNCRWATRTGQMRNRRGNKESTSKYKGVSWHSQQNKWRARITVDGKTIFIGLFTDEEEAAKAYNKYALEFFKEFAYLNNILNLTLFSRHHQPNLHSYSPQCGEPAVHLQYYLRQYSP